MINRKNWLGKFRIRTSGSLVLVRIHHLHSFILVRYFGDYIALYAESLHNAEPSNRLSLPIQIVYSFILLNWYIIVKKLWNKEFAPYNCPAGQARFSSCPEGRSPLYAHGFLAAYFYPKFTPFYFSCFICWVFFSTYMLCVYKTKA